MEIVKKMWSSETVLPGQLTNAFTIHVQTNNTMLQFSVPKDGLSLAELGSYMVSFGQQLQDRSADPDKH